MKIYLILRRPLETAVNAAALTLNKSIDPV